MRCHVSLRRDDADRQRSLCSGFDHFWSLLSADEHRMLAQLAIFQGGCEREVAERVTGATLPTLLDLASRPLLRRMDVTMPNKDGLEALTEIREFNTQDKVIMLTALNQESVIEEAVQLGAKDFLTKPDGARKVDRCAE